MIAIRWYWSQAEAALGKSLLDNYEVLCVLLHENANLYGRAPLAMPVRLVVSEDEADLAACILNGDFEAAAKLEQIGAKMTTVSREMPPLKPQEERPWELLIIAFYFFWPGICFLQTHYPTKVSYSRAVQREIAAVAISHFLGWIGIAFALLLLALFRYAWHSARSTQSRSDNA